MGLETSFLHQPAVSALKGLVRAYQWIGSPFMGRACRFLPTCSCYAHEALDIHGLRALPMIASRLMRCNPLNGREIALDPVPPKPERNHEPA